MLHYKDPIGIREGLRQAGAHHGPDGWESIVPPLLLSNDVDPGWTLVYHWVQSGCRMLRLGVSNDKASSLH